MKKRFFYGLAFVLAASFTTQTTCMGMKKDDDKGKQVELYGKHLLDAPNDTLIRVFLFVPIEKYQELSKTCTSFRATILELIRCFTGLRDPDGYPLFFKQLQSSLPKEKQTLFLYRRLNTSNEIPLSLPGFTSTDLIQAHTMGCISPNLHLQTKLENELLQQIAAQENNAETISNSFFVACLNRNIQISLVLTNRYRDVIIAAIREDSDNFKNELVKAAEEGNFDFVLKTLKAFPELLQNDPHLLKKCIEKIFLTATDFSDLKTLKFLLRTYSTYFNKYPSIIIVCLEKALNGKNQKLIDFFWKTTTTLLEQYEKKLEKFDAIQKKSREPITVHKIKQISDQLQLPDQDPITNTRLCKVAFRTNKIEIIKKIIKIFKNNANMYWEYLSHKMLIDAMDQKCFEIAKLISQEFESFLDQNTLGNYLVHAIVTLDYEKVRFMSEHLANKINPPTPTHRYTPILFDAMKHTEDEYMDMVKLLVKNFQDDPTALILYKEIKLSANLLGFNTIRNFIDEILEQKLTQYKQQYNQMTHKEQKSTTGRVIEKRIFFYDDALSGGNTVLYPYVVDSMKFPENK